MNEGNKGVKTLIVGDSPTQAEQLKHLLETNGCITTVAGSGEEALSILRRQKHALILCDVIMPGMDGYQLCKKIKADEQLQDIPVMLLTALSDAKDVLRGLECNADNLITKPYDEKHLLSSIHQVLINRGSRETEKMQRGVELFFSGRKFVITSERKQILDLLLSTHEAAVQRDIELARVRDELKALNEQLEQKVQERTGALREEIEELNKAETDLRRSKRALEMLTKCNQVLVRSEKETDFLHGICRIITEVGGYRMAWVGYAEQDEIKSVIPVAQTGFEDGYLDTLKITWADTERGRGPTGTAIRTGKPSICKNVLTDPHFSPWRAEAVKRGYASSIVLPLFDKGHVFGSLNIYAAERDAFDEEEVRILSELASDLSYGISVLRASAERGKAEVALRTAGDYNRMLIETSIDPLVAIGSDGKITDVNRATENITGYTRSELIGTDFSSYFVEPGKAREGYEHVFEEGFVRDYPLDIRHRDGHSTAVLYNAAVYRSEAGGVIGVFAAARDITELKRAERQLKIEQQRLYDVLETLPVYVVLLTPDYHVPFANRFFRERFGESHGRRCYEYLFGRSLPCEICETYTVVKTGMPHHWEWTGPDGRNYDIHDFPFPDADGSAIILEMGIDVTERKQAERELNRLNEELEQRVIGRTAQLEAANKELEAFSYSVSHDLRAPLRAIDGFSKLLLEEHKDSLNDEGREYLAIVRNSTQQMGRLIDDLLAFSRFGRQQMRLSPIDMEALAKRVLEELKQGVPERHIEIDIKTLPAGYGDSTLIRQVFSNLLSNALKFTRGRERPSVEVGGQAEESEDVFYVKDNGAGFDMKYAHKLFGVFQRLHSSDEFEGTGVGLAIVKRIIQRHGGRVWAEGEVGRGATFYFTLPGRTAMESNDRLQGR